MENNKRNLQLKILEMVKYLVENGADVNLKNKLEATALTLA